MTIAGAGVTAPQTFGVVNPATGAEHAQAPDCSPEQLEAAMSSAAEAFTEWRKDEQARRKALLAAADALFASAGDLAPVLTAEQGKSLQDATMEVMGTGVWLKYFAELELPREIVQ